MQVLRDRWRGPQQVRAREVARRLLVGEPLADLAWGAIDGRADIRGLWLINTRGLPGIDATDPLATTPTASQVRWSNVDLSGSTLRIDLHEAELSNLRLDRVGWQTWRATSSRLEDCSFEGADLRDSSFDGFNPGLQDADLVSRPSTYVRCDFTRTRIGPYGNFGRAALEQCLFTDTQLPSPMWFRGASLRRCTFVGRFRSVCFGWTGSHSEPAPWLDVDVSGATFAELEVHSHTGPGVA